jgi:predicted nuclease with TOPRIM domain
MKHTYLDVVIGKYSCLIKLNQKRRALELATNELIKEPNFVHRFFNPDFINELVFSEDPAISENICLSIFLKFYELNLDVYHIYVAYDNFLYAQECKTPKDFFEKFDPKNSMHITFLEKVCKHEVLHSSPFYKDQDELDLARIEICNFLTSTVPDFNPFESEVAELLRKVLVRKGIKQIDYSKIYVDIKGLKTSITKELRESFNRNIEIAALPMDQLTKIVDSLGNILVYYIDDADKEAETDEELAEKLRLTSYNRFVHFQDAFLKIRDNFLMSTEHGLDTYLSMRIRHGTLPGQIRSVFESYKLITSFNEVEQKYLDNTEIVEKFPNLSEAEKQKLNDALNKFSGSIDEIAEKLKAQTIQIKTETKQSNGLFDYSYDYDQLLSLFSTKFGSIRQFDDFVEEVISELWNRTEACLASIRSYLNEQFIDKIHACFNTLENSIFEIQSFGDSPSKELLELLSLVKDCRTAIVVEVQKISEWFKRSNKKFIEEFDFSILLDSSVNTLKGSFRDAVINITNHSTVKLDGDLFPIFTDVIFYLFHNALKHSKLKGDQLKISVIVEQDESLICIRFQNNISDEPTYIENLKTRIKNSQSVLADKKPFDRINKEGGTGFPKIKKALSQDLSRKNYKIDIGIEHNESGAPNFVAEISFEYLDLIKK